MRRGFWLCVVAGLSLGAWSQQKPAPPAPPASTTPASAPSDKQDASGLSRDLSFPEDAPAQPPAPSDAAKKRVQSMTPPRSDRVQADDLPGGGQSSSKDAQVDLSPPADDAKAHPKSSVAVAEAEAGAAGGISEFHTWDPHKAATSVEVGDFYFKRKNYRAAEDRYREALRYKDNDAAATIRLAECLEKLGVWDDARAEYESYLKILPHGPEAAEAQKALDRLKAQNSGPKQ